LYVATLRGVQPTHVAAWSAAALAAPAAGTLLLGGLAGRCSDRFGCRPILVGGCALFAAGLGLIAVGEHPAQLVLGRLLQGISVLGIGLTIAVVAASEGATGAALGRLEGATAAGALCGPVLGGWSLQSDALRRLLALCAVLLLWMAYRFWRQLPLAGAPRPPSPAPPKLRWPGHCRRWMAGLLLTQAAAFALVAVFALHMAERFPGLGGLPGWIGLLHASAWAAALVAAPAWGHFNTPRRARSFFCVATAASAVCLLALAASHSIWQVALLRVLLGGCYAALVPSALLALSTAFDPHQHGVVIGSSRALSSIGQLLGPLLVMALHPWLPAAWLLIAVASLFLAAAALSPPRTPIFPSAEVAR